MQTGMKQEIPNETSKSSIATFAVVLSLFMAAVDGTIVTTVLPEIKNSLGQPSLYPWVMSGFLLPVALIAPFAGAVGDRIGIKPTLTISILIFVIASVMATNATSMQMLILARVIQGIGAGSIIVLCYALLAAVFPVNERAKNARYAEWGMGYIIYSRSNSWWFSFINVWLEVDISY